MKQFEARKKGFDGEAIALQFLQEIHYTILYKNFQCKGGEIDIIALTPDGTIVFVEAKYYSEKNWLHPLESITKKKQARLIKAAKYYLLKRGSFNHHTRFDAIVISPDMTATHFQNIFHT